jgi:hypothetical protein
MDPVSKSDRLIRLLRQRLEERSKARSAEAATPASRVQPRGLEATKAIADRFARDGGSDAALRRTLVEQLLAEQFGTSLVNEAKFQQIVDRVTSAIKSDPSTSQIFEQVIAELKKPYQ